MPENLSLQWLHENKPQRAPAPIKVLQFGEGNFLRAFACWIFQRMNDSGLFAGSVGVVQPIARGNLDKLAEQDYLYSLLLRGTENGQLRDDLSVIDVIAGGVNPYADWRGFLDLASGPDIRYVVSNTTEAGIVYVKTPQPSNACPDSFPAKVAAMLAARHQAFSGDVAKGLVFLPCELIENNGGFLKSAVMRHLEDWGAAETVGAWVEASCTFCNTLVDRIVTGFPAAGEAEEIWQRLGCRDELLDVGEYFHLWVIEGAGALPSELPLDKAGLEVVFADSLKPYRDRKVRVLNGAHTANVLAAHLAGADTVMEMMDHATLGAHLKKMVLEEILPGVRLPDAEKRKYAEDVFDRFANPFIRHQLLSISLNSVSKWKVRVLPSLKDFMAERKAVPARLAFSLAALIAFYKGEWVDGEFMGKRETGAYPIRDDKPVLDAFASAWASHPNDMPALAKTLLSDAALWDEDLTLLPGLAAKVAEGLEKIRTEGVVGAVGGLGV